jgi:hypothetical protein
MPTRVAAGPATEIVDGDNGELKLVEGEHRT